MARWKLTAGHYLIVEGTEWEYKEVNRVTGKEIRVRIPVPLFLNPADPGDWTNRINKDEGDIIVSDGNNAAPTDIIFKGDPTPDMVPLDAEAEEISARFAGQWTHPIEGLPSHSQSLIDGMQARMAEAQTPASQPEIAEALSAIAAVMKQNSEILEKLTSTRRV